MRFIHVALKGTMTNPRSKKDHRKNGEKKKAKLGKPIFKKK